MKNLEALVGLNCADIGYRRLNRMLKYFDSAHKVFHASQDELIRIDGIGEKIAGQILAVRKQGLKDELEAVEKLGLTIVTIQDPQYPAQLKDIYDPPLVLYMKGAITEKDALSVAIIGSRRASFYGLMCAERFASQLASFGVTIISGMARGIDTAAHRGALKHNGRTIAVMGSGFRFIYPPENRELADKIAEHGAVITEFPVATPPINTNFPRRNRIVSGLSRGVLVVEAARNSGALITADFALEQGKDVFSLPGEIDEENSAGTNNLIKQGAKMVCSVEDILEELQNSQAKSVKVFGDESAEPVTAPVPPRRHLALDKDEEIIYNNLSASDQPLTVDEICAMCKQHITKVMAVLFKLELKKIVRQLPGKRFVKENK